jgi:hypothetical protein
MPLLENTWQHYCSGIWMPLTFNNCRDIIWNGLWCIKQMFICVICRLLWRQSIYISSPHWCVVYLWPPSELLRAAYTTQCPSRNQTVLGCLVRTFGGEAVEKHFESRLLTYARHVSLRTNCYDVWKNYSNIKKKLHGLSPRANYTDRATAACRRSDCQLLRIEGTTLSAWRIPKAVF